MKWDLSHSESLLEEQDNHLLQIRFRDLSGSFHFWLGKNPPLIYCGQRFKFRCNKGGRYPSYVSRICKFLYSLESAAYLSYTKI